MKLCSSHYDDLRSALHHKGMAPLIGDIATLRERAERWLHGSVLPADGFDPLLVCTLEIYKKATEMIGTHLNLPRPGGEHYCPLCEADRRFGSTAASSWVDNCTDAVLVVCTANGLKLARRM